jgi:hypothetical protein
MTPTLTSDGISGIDVLMVLCAACRTSFTPTKPRMITRPLLSRWNFSNLPASRK